MNQQLQNRFENEQVLHQRNVDLQRKHDDLNRDFRRARTEHQTEMQRQSKELERLYRIKISKRDAIQRQNVSNEVSCNNNLYRSKQQTIPPWHQQPVQVNGVACMDMPKLSMNNFSSVATRCTFAPTLKVRKGSARASPRAKLL